MKEYADEKGFGDAYAHTNVGVFLGTPGKPCRTRTSTAKARSAPGVSSAAAAWWVAGTTRRTPLTKNYLWFAERRGATILPERTVVDGRPLGDSDGADGYAVTSVRSGPWARKDRQTVTARGVVFSAGPLGTNRLPQRCKLSGALPTLSDRLGKLVRTNSESILAVTANNDAHDFARAVAITSSILSEPDTHIEPVTYGRDGDTQSLIMSLPTTGGKRGTRPLFFLLNVMRHPVKFLRTPKVSKSARRTIILLVMPTTENSISLRVRFRLPGGFPVLTTQQDPDNPIPDSIPATYEAGKWASCAACSTSRSPPRTRCCGFRGSPPGRVIVVGAGKASARMAQAVERAWPPGRALSRCCACLRPRR